MKNNSVKALPQDFELAEILWQWLLNGDFSETPSIENTLFFPHLSESVKAVQEVKNGTVEKILAELSETFHQDFTTVFSHFCTHFPKYGLGDIQVKAILKD